MHLKSHLQWLAPTALALSVALAGGTAVLGAHAGKETFTAHVANLSNVGPGGSVGTVNVTINRYSTDQEREKLRTALLENGTKGLFDTLQDMEPVGFIRGEDSVGWDLHYAREIPSGKGRKIVFATDRPISWLEARNQPRTIDYRFTVGELQVNGDGEGQGKLAVAVKMNYDSVDKVLELETFASEPLRLMQVRETD
jgi:hypothetical protein